MNSETVENANGKRYYWMKLRDNFFGELSILALRKLPDGDAICLIYLKLLLHGMKTDGKICYEGVFESLEAEIAAVLGEDELLVTRCIEAIVKFKLADKSEDGLVLCEMDQCVGSETEAAKRMRNLRQKKAAQSKPSSDAHEQCSNESEQCYTEKREKNTEEIIFEKNKKSESFTPPTLSEVESYCKERNNSIDPKKWLDYYTANGFVVGKNKMCDWKAAVRLWEKREAEHLSNADTLNARFVKAQRISLSVKLR